MIGGDAMQKAIDDFNKANTVPQIYRDRLGRYVFMPVPKGILDCCGYAMWIKRK